MRIADLFVLPGLGGLAMHQAMSYGKPVVVSFGDADHVIVTAIFRSREPDDPGFSAKQVVDFMQHNDAHYIASMSDAASFLLERIRSGEVIIVFSAGDATQISARVLETLSTTWQS